MKDTVLITGATGFIGSHLTAKLVQQGRRVRCLVRRTSDLRWLKDLDVETVVADLSDVATLQPLLAEAQTLYHLAGSVAGTRQELRHANVTCTRSLLQACANEGRGIRVILVSSLAAAGPSKPGRPRRVNDRCTPVSQYGVSKLEGEQAALDFADRLPITTVRPAVVFGPRDTEVVQLFQMIRLIRCNPLLGYHNPPIGMIHVHDLVDLLLKSEENGTFLDRAGGPMQDYSLQQGIYFASHPQPMSFRELGLCVRGSLQRPHAWTVPLPIHVVRPFALISQVVCQLRKKRTLFNLDKMREGAQAAWTCDVDRSIAELGWQPQFSLEEGFRNTIQWYIDNKWL